MTTPAFLKEFAINNRWWDGLWGGGHTAATEPSHQGWRAALTAKGGKVLVIGRRGHVGCASVMQMADGTLLDVALYDDATPEAVAKAMGLPRSDPGRDVLIDAVYFQTRPIPGWGLEVLERLQELMRAS